MIYRRGTVETTCRGPEPGDLIQRNTLPTCYIERYFRANKSGVSQAGTYCERGVVAHCLSLHIY